LTDLRFDTFPKVANQIRELKVLASSNKNVVGNPGVGKTHTSIGFVKACMETVLFITRIKRKHDIKPID
jgi:DNA replication protein DnaC